MAWFCGGVLTGLALSRAGWILQPLGWWPAIAIIGWVVGRSRLVGVLAVLVLGLMLGGSRGAYIMQRLQGYNALMQGAVLLQVRASEDAVYGKNGQLTFAANHVINLWTGQQLPGQISVGGLGLNAVYQGDDVMVSGKLRPGLGSYQGFMSFGQLELMQHHPSPITSLRRKFGAGMLSALPEPLASFSMGLLIGERATLPSEVKTNLQKVGLTHIIAVSGANLTIMLEASRKLLGKRSKRLSFLLSASLMLLFVLMTGGSASIVRAAYVSGLSMTAAYYGRHFRPLLLITLVAAITSYSNPLYIWGDASWSLSFLAFFGVLIVSPLLQKRLPRAFSTNLILGIAVESLCAEIMSVPYILCTFGQLSFVGLLANVLVVSMIPYAMLLGLIAGLAGTFWFAWAGWFSWPARLVLIYMLDTAQWLASWPHIFRDDVWLSWSELVVAYAIVGLLALLLSFKDASKSAIITDNKSL